MSVRQLLCETCGADRKDCASRLVYERTAIEPAEYERVVWGVTRHPQPEQRVMHINDDPMPLPLHSYNCDLCSADIRPGARACAVSYWAESDQAPPAWEAEFVIPEVAAV